MNILTLDDITLMYGQRKVFDHASFYLQEGEKVGVIGINGTGKSTLLKLLAGFEKPDSGSVIQANGQVIQYLPQTPVFDSQWTVLEAVMRKTNGDVESPERLAEAKAMLTKLGVTDFQQPCGQLSGGQKKRLALVAVLLSNAEILILDEPTNHLDSEMADWLENTLRKFRGAVVMVTHDRYFLDSVSNRIVEVDKGQIYSYDANYSGYLELKMQREEMERASARKRASILRNELAWVQRGAQARSTKQKARLERYEVLKNTKGPVEDGRVELSSMNSRLGRTTVEIENLCKSYPGMEMIQDFTYIFLKNDRVGFVGKNGCGKSTLMKMLVGIEQPDSGTISIGQTVKIGYYAQETDESIMKPQMKVIDYIREVAEYVETPEGKITAARMLERFLFEGENQYGALGKLSGGERRRLHLCRVLMGAPNVLILDEPTNDLDITTLQILEDYLDSFQGIVIVVSHDRYFLDRVVNRIFAFQDHGQLVQYEGGYTDYVNKRPPVEEGALSSKENKTGASKTGRDWKSGQKKKRKLTYNEQKEYDTIEDVIAALEEKIEQLDQELLKYTTDFVKLNELTKEKEESEAMLELKMNRWMELEELIREIEEENSML